MVVGQEAGAAETDRVFQALADATRRDILTRVIRAERSVSALAQCYPMSFAAVQKHVAVLERAALTGTLLAGWPEGLAVVLAVKGLGRFDELRTPAAAERFIVGTLASALWAAACAGLVVLLRV